jgi:hypothetical protein
VHARLRDGERALLVVTPLDAAGGGPAAPGYAPPGPTP